MVCAGLQLFLDEFEGIIGLSGEGLVCLDVCYSDSAVFGSYVDLGVKP